MTSIPKTRDGHQWTENTGLESGIPCIGVIQPPTNIRSTQETYDVAVIGAGYTGLTAARDLAISGHKVLLLEARDRIGGRTWSSNIEGYPYEMGGTWVHWNQPMVYREIARYDMRKELEISHDNSRGVNHFMLHTQHGRRFFSKEEELALTEVVMKKFVNVDGEFCRKLIPFPHDPHYNAAEIAFYDQMSLADRLAQIKDDVSPTEYEAFVGFLSITCGGKMEEASFFEMLRWWALNNYDMTQFMELCLMFKFRCGQSGFARRFFDEAVATRKLSYAFSSPIAAVKDNGRGVEITSTTGQQFKASRVICTVPLNVLNTINFSPPLSPAKQEAAALGHVNQVSKVHIEASNPELRSYSAIMYPDNGLTYIFGDGTTPAGNTHLVSFGQSCIKPLRLEEDIDETIQAFQNFTTMKTKRVVFHNWVKDDFAKGTWEWLRPNMATKYLDSLRERQGNIIFASADWAIGWRGFIDGGIEDGARAAMDVSRELREQRPAPKL